MTYGNNEELIHETDDGLMVYLTRETDDDPDLSHYGKFTSKVGDYRFYFDRETGELRDSWTTKTIKDEYGDETSEELLVADIPTRGRERNTYEFIADFQEGWELEGNSKVYREAFAENVKNGEFRKLGINPKRCKGRRSGYWMAVLCMAQDVKRLEDFNNGYWEMEFVKVEVKNESGKVLAEDSLGGIESDDTSDPMKAHFSLETLLNDARIARGDYRETSIQNGQLELVTV